MAAMPPKQAEDAVWVNLQVPRALHDVVRHLSIDAGVKVHVTYQGLIRKALEERRLEELDHEV
jgi:hypothetical protein